MTNDCERCGQSDDWFRTCAECAKRVCIDCLNPWSLKTDGDLCTVCARPLLPEWHPAKDHKACVTCGAALFDNNYMTGIDGDHCNRCGKRHNAEFEARAAACICTVSQPRADCPAPGHAQFAAIEATDARRARRRFR